MFPEHQDFHADCDRNMYWAKMPPKRFRHVTWDRHFLQFHGCLFCDFKFIDDAEGFVSKAGVTERVAKMMLMFDATRTFERIPSLLGYHVMGGEPVFEIVNPLDVECLSVGLLTKSDFPMLTSFDGDWDNFFEWYDGADAVRFAHNETWNMTEQIVYARSPPNGCDVILRRDASGQLRQLGDELSLARSLCQLWESSIMEYGKERCDVLGDISARSHDGIEVAEAMFSFGKEELVLQPKIEALLSGVDVDDIAPLVENDPFWFI